ncbi:MAG TPA: succinate dehydrogenase, cytochrome b556 subunit, partial [Pseudoxanthomonas sp.]|nr:succinate dehydrogenase, cytochrome b556 subunit [Pseudoxanthomonas sp.]
MATPQRPLSPHLDVYRWQIQMVTSILHRATGIFLAFGALIIAAGLMALMLGPEAWNCFRDVAG